MRLEESLDRGKAIETKTDEKKKGYLRQLSERLTLDPASKDLKAGMDQSKSADSKKSLEQIITELKKERQNKINEAFSERGEEIKEHFSKFMSFSKFENLMSLRSEIQKKEFDLLDEFCDFLPLKYSDQKAIRCYYDCEVIAKVKKYVDEKNALLKEFKKKLQE
jgi:hypothetical protein